MNFPSICSNIPATLANRIDVFQLIHSTRACNSYQYYLDKWLLLTGKLHDGAIRGTETAYPSGAPELFRVLVRYVLLDL